MSALPATHDAALRWLVDRGGEGVIDRYGRVVAQGDIYKSGDTSQVWLRLVASGHITGAGPARLKLTRPGRSYADRLPPEPEPDNIPFAGARPNGRMADDNPEDFA